MQNFNHVEKCFRIKCPTGQKFNLFRQIKLETSTYGAFKTFQEIFRDAYLFPLDIPMLSKLKD